MVMERWGRASGRRRLPTFETIPQKNLTERPEKKSVKKACDRIRRRERDSVLKIMKPDCAVYPIQSDYKTEGVSSHEFVSIVQGGGSFSHSYLGPGQVFGDASVEAIVDGFYPVVRELYREDLETDPDDGEVQPLDFTCEGK